MSDLSKARIAEILTALFERESSAPEFATGELTDKAIAKVCAVLGVAPANRWTFEHAVVEIDKISNGSDDGTTYIIDLNESGGSDTRGLEILSQLAAKGSIGNAFILTHAASILTESDKDAELRQELSKRGGNAVQLPICVIAKERLFDYENDEPSATVS